MANHPCGKKPQNHTTPINTGTSSFSEPEVRRWSHPVTGITPNPKTETVLQYVRCALSYQNQLLADIKTLLEEIRLEMRSGTAEK